MQIVQLILLLIGVILLFIAGFNVALTRVSLLALGAAFCFLAIGLPLIVNA